MSIFPIYPVIAHLWPKLAENKSAERAFKIFGRKLAENDLVVQFMRYVYLPVSYAHLTPEAFGADRGIFGPAPSQDAEVVNIDARAKRAKRKG